MRRTSHLLAAAAALTLTAGCSADTAATAVQTYKDARQSSRAANATTLAGSALAAQSALYHIASALSGQVAQDADKPRAFRVAQAADQPVYSIDTAAGTGQVALSRGGKKAIELTFKFEREDRDGGVLYSVSSLRGTTEGFQVLLPRLSLAYTVATDDQGNTVKSADGKSVFVLSVKANGFLGVANRPMFQIADMTVNTRYPFAAGETKLGSVKLYSPEGLVFLGDAYLAGQAVTARGQVTDAAGTRLYDLAVGADAKVSLTPAAAPAPTP